jgi:hypothetical protein
MAIVKCACVVMVMLVLVAVRELGGVHARVGKDETPAPSQEPVIWPEQLVDGELKTGAIVHLAADEPEFRAALTRSGVSWDRMMKTMLGGTYRVNTVSQQQDGTQFATLTSPDDVAGQADWRVPAEVLTIAAGALTRACACCACQNRWDCAKGGRGRRGGGGCNFIGSF